jgi:hypothetical protein
MTSQKAVHTNKNGFRPFGWIRNRLGANRSANARRDVRRRITDSAGSSTLFIDGPNAFQQLNPNAPCSGLEQQGLLQ